MDNEQLAAQVLQLAARVEDLERRLEKTYLSNGGRNYPKPEYELVIPPKADIG